MAKTPSSQAESTPSNPWRDTFEVLKAQLAKNGIQRDDNGTVGSINWLRKAMEARGANPNVVRNILYRDKGKLEDKRILFQLLSELWQRAGQGKLQVPELEVMLSTSSSNEQEVMQLLGREKRRAYRHFVGGVRSDHHPKMLVMGRTGSGKTLLTDYIQEALERPPVIEAQVIRLGFSRSDMDASLGRLAQMVGVARERFESRLLRVGASGAFAVQADAQAEVARIIVDEIRQQKKPFVFLLHISQVVGTEGEDTLAGVPLRLFQDDVPRVSSTEWLWENLIVPLSKLGHISIFVSMVEVLARVRLHLATFPEPIKLNPPTAAEARNFVRSRLPQLSSEEQEALVERAKRSFEDLRTLTLLAEIRDALGVDAPTQNSERYIQQLSHLVGSVGHESLKRFLGALGLLSLQEYPSFHISAMLHLQYGEQAKNLPQELTNLEQAFLDGVPAQEGMLRSFSRSLARALRQELRQGDPSLYQELSRAASHYYQPLAEQNPREEAGYRYSYYLLAAEAWQEMANWLEQHSLPQALMQRLWQQLQAKRQRLPRQDENHTILDILTYRIAAYYVRMGSYHHQEAQEALAYLESSALPALRLWTQIKKAEGHVNRGQYKQAEAVLQSLPKVEAISPSTLKGAHEPASSAEVARAQLQAALALDLQPSLLHLELSLVKAAVARWHSNLPQAAELIHSVAHHDLQSLMDNNQNSPHLAWLRSQIHMWAGLIAKDKGDFPHALQEFQTSEQALASDNNPHNVPVSLHQWRNDHEVVRARLAFQQGDIFMKLGRFGDAESALSQALHLSENAEASVHERLRYLARLAHLYRRCKRFAEAKQHLEQAQQLLNNADLNAIEATFEQSKLDFACAQLQLAQGNFDHAIFLLQQHIDSLRHYQHERQVDTSFRQLRATLGLARAYWGRALGQAWGFPFITLTIAPNLAQAQPPDYQHAVSLMEGLLETLHDNPQRYASLQQPIMWSASLIMPDYQPSQAQEKAQEHEKGALTFAYDHALEQAYRAARALRTRHLSEAQRHLHHAQDYLAETRASDNQQQSDEALALWLAYIGLRLTMQEAQPSKVISQLQAILEPPFDKQRPAQKAIIAVAADWFSSEAVQANERTELTAFLALFGLESSQLEPKHLRLRDSVLRTWHQAAQEQALD